MKKLCTIPNAISVVRIALVPVFLLCYVRGQALESKGLLLTALLLMIASGVSDKLDGFIARRFHQVSETGKWLDPLADKLTQVTLAALMCWQFSRPGQSPWMRAFGWVFLLFIAKEVIMLLFALLMLLLKKRPAAAEVWGKVATVLFYVVMCVLLLAGPGVGVLRLWSPLLVLPGLAVQIMVIVNLVLTFVAFFSYFPDTFRKLFHK